MARRYLEDAREEQRRCRLLIPERDLAATHGEGHAQLTASSLGPAARVPEPLDAGELLARAQRKGVSYLPGKYFAVNRPEPGSLRLSFAGLAPGFIEQGVEILGEIFSSELERVRGSRNREPAPAMV